MNIKWVKILDSTNVIKEALRTLKGYGEKIDGYEVKSLIDYELSQENYNYLLHPSLSDVDNVNCNAIKDAYIKQIGKNPRKDGVFGTCIITLPRVVGRDEEDFPDISEMDVEEARKAMCKFYAGYEKGKRWLEAAVDSFIEVMNIRVDDILYAAVHMEETTPHVHVGFLPTYPMLDENKEVRKDDAGNEIRGCDRSIVSRGFLKSFHRKMVEAMNERKQPYADALVTGEGYLFDPQKMNKVERIAATEEMIKDEILQEKVDKGLISPEEAEGQFYYKKNRLKNKDTLIKEKEDEVIRLSENATYLQNRVGSLLESQAKTKKNIELYELEIQDKIADMESNLSGLMNKMLSDFKIELIGLSENEASERIKVLCGEMADKVKEEMAPVVRVLDDMKNSLVGINQEDVNVEVEMDRE